MASSRQPAGVFFEPTDEEFALLASILYSSTSTNDSGHGSNVRSPHRGKFTMAIVGHSAFAGGYDTVLTDERREPPNSQRPGGALYLLTINHVRVAMAGDTHDFEYYRERSGADAARTMHHFITGGGGVSEHRDRLDFSEGTSVGDWLFIRGPTAFAAKMEAEMPLWKQLVSGTGSSATHGRQHRGLVRLFDFTTHHSSELSWRSGREIEKACRFCPQRCRRLLHLA